MRARFRVCSGSLTVGWLVAGILVACGEDDSSGLARSEDAGHDRSSADASSRDAQATDAQVRRDASLDDVQDGAATALSFARWTKLPERAFRGQIFEGDVSLASDPCVLHDGALWRMVYTCAASANTGGFCQVTSSDGIAWAPIHSITQGIDGLIAEGSALGWDQNIETCSLVREEGGLSLYYSGYQNLDLTGNRAPAALGRLRSVDGVTFARDPQVPVLSPTKNGPDSDDIFSAVGIPRAGALDLVYVGWCIDGYHDGLPCTTGPAIQLLGATRDASGTWIKRDRPVLAPSTDLPWLTAGVAEPALVQAEDGRFYLFFTGSLDDGKPRATGLAVGPTAFGPWQVGREPILEGTPGATDACGAFAPSVVIDGPRARMWYLALDDCGGSCTSCDHASCGCEPRYSIGYAESPWPPVTQ